MTPLELMSREDWTGMLARIAEETSMTATLTDDKGNHILEEQGQRYPLCLKIREQEASRTFICSQTNVAMLEEVKRTKRPLIHECEAGLVRMVVPVCREGVLIGQVTACGLATEEEEEIDPFLIAKQVGLSEGEVEDLATLTPAISKADVGRIADRLHAELNP